MEAWADDIGCVIPGLDSQVKDRALSIASSILWALSGRRFGLRQTTVRPCRRSCMSADPASRYPWWGASVAWNGNYLYDPGCGTCASRCTCEFLDQIQLPRYPVREVTDVSIDGVVLGPGTDYRLDDSGWLVRLNGNRWPMCQGNFSVSFLYGEPVPDGGAWAAERLSCEVARAMIGDEECELPKRVQSITRQGVTMGFIDGMEFLDKGRVGLNDVDMWLATVNPHRLTRRPRVFRADKAPLSRRIG